MTLQHIVLFSFPRELSEDEAAHREVEPEEVRERAHLVLQRDRRDHPDNRDHHKQFD